MLIEELEQPVSSLPGIGPAAAGNLGRLGIIAVRDLLSYWPRGYDDRSRENPIENFTRNPKINTVAYVIGHSWIGYGRMKTLKIHIRDKTSEAVLVCFNRNFLEKTLTPGSVFYLTGKFFYKYGEIQSSSFEVTKITGLTFTPLMPLEKLPPFSGGKILPVYSLKEGVGQKILRKAVEEALKAYAPVIDSVVPFRYFEDRRLFDIREAVKKIHFPGHIDEAEKARETLAYEELFKFEFFLGKRIIKKKGSLTFEVPGEVQNLPLILSPSQKKLLESLPFELTEDQKTVLGRINYDIDASPLPESGKAPVPMWRLLQGDVGSGKTLVAFLAALRIFDMGGQTAFLAPTELLARQHGENAAKLLDPLGVRIAFLTGTTTGKDRALLLEALKNGNIDFLIGTHALFSKDVVYKDLKLAIIDEQHRFGVMQRSAIARKGNSPHLLMMSATPIPRSLALTVFGDLDVSVIKTMPKGRKPVITHLASLENDVKVYSFVRNLLAKGQQGYFVYPLIQREEDWAEEESETESFSTGLKSAREMYEKLSTVIFPEFPCALIHSKIPEDEQQEIMRKFKENKISVLVATSVVEVGVDVPNATFMVIEEAQRFGLAALHQLRGRVGRGELQAYCFLVYGKNLTEEGKQRLKVLHESQDGFYIAEEDLKLRGPGSARGIKQSGYISLGISDPLEDSELLEKAREDAFDFISRGGEIPETTHIGDKFY